VLALFLIRVHILEPHAGVWSVSGQAATADAQIAVGAMPAGAAAEPVEEQTEFDVILKDIGPKKIDVIKAIRQITQLGLKDAKDLAETQGGKVLEQAGKEVAQDAKTKLETAGATIDLV
jgi:large subunit ribosomal protein L7/L12